MVVILCEFTNVNLVSTQHCSSTFRRFCKNIVFNWGAPQAGLLNKSSQLQILCVTKFVIVLDKILATLFCATCGLYYKHMTIVNDDSSVIIVQSFQLIVDARGIISGHSMFIIQATGLLNICSHSTLNFRRGQICNCQRYYFGHTQLCYLSGTKMFDKPTSVALQ